ncbi:peptidylprolyl isomerase [bacterium]|nr:MAG: peptidylprolyl isomerase [bacterium]
MRIKSVSVMVMALALLFSGCVGKEKKSEEPAENPEKKEVSAEASKTKATEETLSPDSRPIVVIETDYGNIEVELRPDKAPKTCANFVKLVKQGFYDSLTFHRIVPGFVIQGGDPEGTGRGGPGYTIPAEISDLKHTVGAVACARKPDQVNPNRESSGSQFYITLTPTPHLDGGYTIFGYVKNGMDVVNKIAKVETGPGDKPLQPVYMKKLYIKEESGTQKE